MGKAMTAKSVHIVILEDLAEQINALVGLEERSAFVVETAHAGLRERALPAFLESDEPAWRDEDHAELAAMGTPTWVKSQRVADEQRLQGLHNRPYQIGDSLNGK